MKPWHFAAVLVLAGGFGSSGLAQTPSEEIAKLKKEIVALRAEIAEMRKELGLKPIAVQSPAALAARFDAASSLSSVNERESVFAKLCIDAAKAGDGKLVKKALDNVSSVNTREQCMYRAALALAQAGNTEDAVVLAKSISSVNQREQALAKIAKGETEN